MKIRETCGCGASIEVYDRYATDAVRAVEAWRNDHEHVSRRPTSTNSDEQAGPGVLVPERDPRSTTALEHERAADGYGFGFSESQVIA